QQVRVGQRDGVLGREAADAGERVDGAALDRRGRAGAAQPGQCATGLADAGQLVDDRDRGQCGADHHGDRHQAPSIIWPQTRTTLPLTAVEPGEAYHAMVSATSTGRPPCDRELRRWPTSREANGIASVIFVMMKPGATALMVIPSP